MSKDEGIIDFIEYGLTSNFFISDKNLILMNPLKLQSIKIIGIIGNYQSGKSLIANYLVSEYEFEKYSLNQPIQDYFNRHSVHEPIKYTNYKQSANIYHNDFMVKTKMDDSFIIEELQKKCFGEDNKGRRIVLTEIYFQKEIDFIKKNGGIILKVERKESIIESNVCILKDIDIFIKNNDTIKKLHSEIDKISRYFEYSQYQISKYNECRNYWNISFVNIDDNILELINYDKAYSIYCFLNDNLNKRRIKQIHLTDQNIFFIHDGSKYSYMCENGKIFYYPLKYYLYMYYRNQFFGEFKKVEITDDSLTTTFAQNGIWDNIEHKKTIKITRKEDLFSNIFLFKYVDERKREKTWKEIVEEYSKYSRKMLKFELETHNIVIPVLYSIILDCLFAIQEFA